MKSPSEKDDGRGNPGHLRDRWEPGVLACLANVYRRYGGIDVFASCIESAQILFPDLRSYLGTVSDLLRSSDFKPYDAVISPEVIEHAIDKEHFADELPEYLVPDGNVILVAALGEEF